MGYNVLRTDAFEESYDSAIGYLANTLKSPIAAKHLMDRMDKIVAILEETPYMNAVSNKPFLAAKSLREHFFMNYVIVYLVEENTVELVNLFHQTQNYCDERYWANENAHS